MIFECCVAEMGSIQIPIHLVNIQRMFVWSLLVSLRFIVILTVVAQICPLHFQLLCTDHLWTDSGVPCPMKLTQVYLQSKTRVTMQIKPLKSQHDCIVFNYHSLKMSSFSIIKLIHLESASKKSLTIAIRSLSHEFVNQNNNLFKNRRFLANNKLLSFSQKSIIWLRFGHKSDYFDLLLF